LSFKKGRNHLYNFLAFGSIIENNNEHKKSLFPFKNIHSATPWTLPPTAPAPLPSLSPLQWLQHISVHNVYRLRDNGKLLDATDAASQ
jgi:hypothetical protein